MNKIKIFKILGAFAFLVVIAVGYQNCGANSGTFNLGSSESASSGTITNTSQIAGPITAAGSSVANGGHSCAISFGAVKCWGDNTNGELGNGNIGGYSPTAGILSPPIPGTIVKVISSPTNTCALVSNFLVYCWGDNTYGQLGNGQITAPVVAPSPVTAFNGLQIYDIALTDGTLCGVTRTGVIACVGTNGNGELGVSNATTASSLSPVFVSGITNAVSITGNISHFCATEITGAIWCWGGGGNAVNLGNNMMTTTASLPVNVLGVAPGSPKIVTGPIDTCITLSPSGEMQCFGDNTFGQLAIGNLSQTAYVSAVTGGLTFTSVSVTTGTVCGLTTSSEIYCWGAWGTSTLSSPTGPVKYGSTYNDIVAIAGTGVHQCALHSGGTATCWGQNATAELGDGNNTAVATVTTPVQVLNFP